MTRRTLAVVAAAAGLAVVAAQPAQAAHPRLLGTVGPGFTITLKNAHGKKVTTLKPGTYTVVISDRFFDSTTVYQGVARKLPPGIVETLNSFAVGDARRDRRGYGR